MNSVIAHGLTSGLRANETAGTKKAHVPAFLIRGTGGKTVARWWISNENGFFLRELCVSGQMRYLKTSNLSPQMLHFDILCIVTDI